MLVFCHGHFCNILCSPQINLASVDESTGRMTGGFTTYATFDAIRRSVLIHMYNIYRFFTNIYHVLLCRMGDDCINRLTEKNCIVDKKF